MISHTFIDRPIFASVVSIVVVVMGLLAMQFLPIAQFPEITPPVVQIDADNAGTGYTGAFDVSTVGLFERQGVDVAVGYTGTQFTEGKRTVRADTRAALAWFRPVAFCQNTGL